MTSSSSTTISPTNYFTLDPIDRDFQNYGRYGNGYCQIYYRCSDDEKSDWVCEYINPDGAKYQDGKLTINTFSKTNITLEKDPDIESFKKIIYNDWKLWDKDFGEGDDDRIDYEPWAHVSIESTAYALNCLFDDDVVKLHSKAG